jgi:hypothetical protein
MIVRAAPPTTIPGATETGRVRGGPELLCATSGYSGCGVGEALGLRIGLGAASVAGDIRNWGGKVGKQKSPRDDVPEATVGASIVKLRLQRCGACATIPASGRCPKAVKVPKIGRAGVIHGSWKLEAGENGRKGRGTCARQGEAWAALVR